MTADYIANPLYDSNPFIEALPPMLAGKDLIRALASIPPYSDNDRDRSTGERLQLLSSHDNRPVLRGLHRLTALLWAVFHATRGCGPAKRLCAHAWERLGGLYRRRKFIFCHRCIGPWQVYRIAARVIAVPTGH